MRWIDDEGRLAGRINIIDAALVACVLALVPIGYTSVRLFRLRPPTIMTVEPTEQLVGTDLHIRLHGRDFRPALRALFGRTHQPFSLVGEYAGPIEGRLVAETAADLEIVLPRLSAGEYDLHLYDQTHEVAKRVGAVTLRMPPYQDSWTRVHVQFSGILFPPEEVAGRGDVDVSRETAAESEIGVPDPRAAVLTSLGTPLKGSRGTETGSIVVYATEVDFDIPVRRVRDGLMMYRRQAIRLGSPFTFQTTRYVWNGTITSMTEELKTH